jgi:hypothetical protein
MIISDDDNLKWHYHYKHDYNHNWWLYEHIMTIVNEASRLTLTIGASLTIVMTIVMCLLYRKHVSRRWKVKEPRCSLRWCIDVYYKGLLMHNKLERFGPVKQNFKEPTQMRLPTWPENSSTAQKCCIAINALAYYVEVGLQ